MEVWVARPWANIEVTAFITDSVVGASMDLDQFLFVLAMESGDVSLYDKLKAASDIVTTKMKRETAKVSRNP